MFSLTPVKADRTPPLLQFRKRWESRQECGIDILRLPIDGRCAPAQQEQRNLRHMLRVQTTAIGWIRQVRSIRQRLEPRASRHARQHHARTYGVDAQAACGERTGGGPDEDGDCEEMASATDDEMFELIDRELGIA